MKDRNMRQRDSNTRSANRAAKSAGRGLVPSTIKGLMRRPIPSRLYNRLKPFSSTGGKSGLSLASGARRSLYLFLVLTIVLSVIAAPVASDTTEQFSSKWSLEDPLNAGTGNYAGVVMDSNGDVYVAKQENQNADKTLAKLDQNDGSEIWSLAVSDFKNVNSHFDHLGGGAAVSDSQFEALERGNNGLVVIANNDTDGTNDILFLVGEGGSIKDDIALGYDWNAGNHENGLNYAGTNVVTFRDGVDYKTYDTDTGTLSVNNTASGVQIDASQVDTFSDVWFIQDQTVKKRDNPLNVQYYGQNGFLVSRGTTVVINGSGQGTDAFVGQVNGEVSQVDAAADDSSMSKGWEKTLTSLDTAITSSAYDSQRGLTGFGAKDGLLYIRNVSDGTSVGTGDLGDSSNVVALDMNDGRLVGLQADGTLEYFTLPSAPSPTQTPTPTPTPTPTITFGPGTPPAGGQGYSDYSWGNWTSLNPGEKAILIFTDFSILYLLMMALLSTAMIRWTGEPKIGLGALFALTAIGWVADYLPAFVALTLLIFYVFFGYAGERMLGGS